MVDRGKLEDHDGVSVRDTGRKQIKDQLGQKYEEGKKLTLESNECSPQSCKKQPTISAVVFSPIRFQFLRPARPQACASFRENKVSPLWLGRYQLEQSLPLPGSSLVIFRSLLGVTALCSAEG